jgi:streptomycin 6-kinase
VYESQRRPITAGGFVDSGPTVFQDVTDRAGLGTWRHVMGTPEKKYTLEADGSGVGLIDYDNDGWLDVYLVNGSTYRALDGKKGPPHAALFHNNHDGTFRAKGQLRRSAATFPSTAKRVRPEPDTHRK